MRNVVFRPTTIGALLAAALAFAALAAAGSASAATQHWAGASQVPYGSTQSFSSEAWAETSLTWELGGAQVGMACASPATSGNVENPSGGGSGAIDEATFALENCWFTGSNHNNCAVKGGSISFGSVQAAAYEESGEYGLVYSPKSGNFPNLEIVAIGGNKCNLAASYPLTGYFKAREASEPNGHFEIQPKDTNLKLASYPLTVNTAFILMAPSEEPLVLSSTASPGAPHWYLGDAAWNTFTSGEATTFASNGEMSIDLKGPIYGSSVELSCSGGENGISGSVLNPTGGGAGTATASATFGNCSIPNTGKMICLVQTPFTSNELEAVATESGGTPAAEFAPVEGKPIATITVKNGGGSQKCNIAGTWTMTGTLIASSEGDGYFDFSDSDIQVNGNSMTTSGRVALETKAGKTLRLQP